MFISFHHCGEFVGDPITAEGKLYCTVGEFEISALSMDEKPVRISWTRRSEITQVSPTERSVFLIG